MIARSARIATDTLAGLVLVAWVGGHAALGAFAARIAFGVLPREDAARTMTRVFHEFDALIWVGIFVLAACALVGLWARGGGAPSQVRFGLELGLCALGVFELTRIHPQIEQMFEAGRTLEPAFRALHTASERCAHGEVSIAVALLFVRALARPA